MATSGTDKGRRSAILVLGTSTEPERVGEVLGKLFRDSELGLELPALRALAQLGGSHGQAALREALSGTTDVTAEALAALAQYGIGDSLPLVRELLASSRSTEHATGLLLYFQAADFEINSEDTKSLVRLASDPSLKKSVRKKILLALPDMRVDWAKTNSKLLTRTKEDVDPSLAQAALICMARFGHKTEKKELLKPFKSAIDADSDRPQPLEARGELYILLHEYEDALRDFERAIKVHAETGKSVYASNKAFIGAARAQILDGDLRAAAKTLEESSLSTLQLRSLGVDPDFAPLVESDKYNEVLRLK
ncbi:MAG: tetratricopeptide (TPR) repeat protein [Gammaproteobacteria bacterium]